MKKIETCEKLKRKEISKRKKEEEIKIKTRKVKYATKWAVPTWLNTPKGVSNFCISISKVDVTIGPWQVKSFSRGIFHEIIMDSEIYRNGKASPLHPSYPYMVTYNISMILAFFNGVAYPATPNPKHGLVDRENYSLAFKLKLNRSCLFITFSNLSVIVTGILYYPTFS